MNRTKQFWIGLVCCVGLLLSSCAGGVGGLQAYNAPDSSYRFLYPNGWVAVDVRGASPGVDVVFRDIIEQSENLSVIISQVPEDKSLSELGSPTEVGYRFLKETKNDEGRETEFISAEALEHDGNTYYLLEYEVDLPNSQTRHNLASVAVSRGKLYTFNLSTRAGRWSSVGNAFKTAAQSFTIL
ncbi:MAG: photosystem II reaction center PsbP [Cyanobacteria bacterium P01_H01_bin.15]